MKIVFLTGSHPRHAYLARALEASGHLAGLVIEQREAFIPEPPANLAPATRALYLRHFADRDDAEQRFFGAARLPEVPCLALDAARLNSTETAHFINAIQADLLLSYGVHKLTPETLNATGRPLKWNIHGGLSPWYRGVITHFWPSYCLEPQMTGMTVHELSADIDGGALIHQCAAELVRGDGIHDLACRAVTALSGELAALAALVAAGRLKPPVPQRSTGRIWRAADWQPAHLHPVYDFYENRIVDRYLDGDFDQRPPVLVRQFSV